MSDDTTIFDHALQTQQILEASRLAEVPIQEQLFLSQPEITTMDDDRPASKAPFLARVVAAILFLIGFVFVAGVIISGQPAFR